jgi:hypothetical protein
MAIKEFVAFSGKNPGRLSLQRTRGLFAELLFIHRLLGSGKTSPAVLKAWKGPHLQEGVGMHDFVFAEGDSYEVKATSHPSTEIRVSSVLQLVPGNHSLHLVVVPLETLEHDSRYGQTISQLALSCLELFEKSGLHYVAEFMDALLGIGFDLTDGYYGQWKFATEPWRHFEVRQGFPVLDLRGVPSAITKIRYSLELALLVDFEIRNPAIFSPGGDSGHSRTAERD